MFLSSAPDDESGERGGVGPNPDIAVQLRGPGHVSRTANTTLATSHSSKTRLRAS